MKDLRRSRFAVQQSRRCPVDSRRPHRSAQPQVLSCIPSGRRQAFRPSILEIVEISCPRGTAGPNQYDSNPPHVDGQKGRCQAAAVKLPVAEKQKNARWPSGPLGELALSGRSGMTALLFDRFAPIQRIRITPRISWLVKPIAGTDKVVGRGEIVGCIRDHRTPSIVPRTPFQCAHKAQLKRVAAVPFQYADPTEISCIVSARRWNQAGKGDRDGLVESEPPMSLIEFRNGSTIEECQTVKVCQHIRHFVVMPVDFAYPVHIGHTPETLGP